MRKKQKYPYQKDGVTLYRDYCFLLNGEKYNRNISCKFHDNAYGIHGGGNGDDRKKADQSLYMALKGNKDPMARIIYVIVRLFGWFFFNYHPPHLWQGQLTKKIQKLFSFQ